MEDLSFVVDVQPDNPDGCALIGAGSERRYVQDNGGLHN